jgi:hypothetical protein
MFSLKTFAVLAAATTIATAQAVPDPPLGGSDCRIADASGFNFVQVVFRTVTNFEPLCETFQNEMNSICAGVVVTCERDINSPQLKYFFFETDSSCPASDIEQVIRQSTDEESPLCNYVN